MSTARERLDAALDERKAAREEGIPKGTGAYVPTARMAAADRWVTEEALRLARVEAAKRCLEDAIEAVGPAEAVTIAAVFLRQDLERGFQIKLPED